jgi:hypothetical protein
LHCYPAIPPCNSDSIRVQKLPELFDALGVDKVFQLNSQSRTREAAVRRLGTFLVCVIAGLTASCAGLNGSSSTGTDRVAITPSAPSVRAHGTQAFAATVAKETNPTVTWTVNDIVNGNAMVGTITSTGPLTANYTAPASLPSPNAVTIAAAVPNHKGLTASTVTTLLNPVPQLSSATPPQIDSGNFAITSNGSNFVSGAVVNMGSTALSTTFVSSTKLTATGSVTSQTPSVQFTVTNPDPGSATSGTLTAQVVQAISPNVADRFLEQTTFGPTPTLVAQVQQSGLQAFLTNQFAMAATPYADPAMTETSLGPLQQRFFVQTLTAQDQLRQRAAFALSQIFVIAGDKIASGGLLPGGQSAAQDLDGAIDNIFNHPNLPPFVSRDLIQHLVTSNPSPAYIQRVSEVFKNNGASVRGDMKAVITAILLDPEARRGDDSTTANAGDGHLQEPILYVTGLLRAFGASSDGANLSGQGGGMGQNALFPGSVFNFFSPNFVVPGTSLYGPEFQILTTATTLNRANFVNTFVFGSLGSTTTVNFGSYASQASNPGALLDSLNTLMLHGTMTADMKTSLLTAMQAVPAGTNQALQQAQTAIYLIGTSSQYQVQH